MQYIEKYYMVGPSVAYIKLLNTRARGREREREAFLHVTHRITLTQMITSATLLNLYCIIGYSRTL